MTQREKIEEIVKRIDHSKTLDNPEGNPFHAGSISDNDAITQIETLITEGKLEALDNLLPSMRPGEYALWVRTEIIERRKALQASLGGKDE